MGDPDLMTTGIVGRGDKGSDNAEQRGPCGTPQGDTLYKPRRETSGSQTCQHLGHGLPVSRAG